MENTCSEIGRLHNPHMKHSGCHSIPRAEIVLAAPRAIPSADATGRPHPAHVEEDER